MTREVRCRVGLSCYGSGVDTLTITMGLVIGYSLASHTFTQSSEGSGMEIDQRGNAVLGTLLAELGWSPSRLTEAVDGVLGPGYVARQHGIGMTASGPGAP